ncbi:MAG: ABC transporter permease [Verrucomicrobiota bacterium]
MKGLASQAAWPLGVLVFVVLGWHGATVLFESPSYILPAPGRVLTACVERHDNLLLAVRTSAVAALSGFVAAAVLGILAAVVLAQSPLVRRCLVPYTILLQTVPVVAIAPLILMWFGSGLRSVVIVVAIICLFPIIANTTQGLVSVDRNLLDLFRMSNASRLQVLVRLRLPHALPALFTGLRISSGLSVIGAFTGEWFASSNTVGQGGLGYSIIYANSQLQTDYLFALVLACAVLGSSFFFAVVGCEWLLLHRWHESALKAEGE